MRKARAPPSSHVHICSHCGKPNHETKQCWLKPQSTTYRSDLAKGHCQTNVEATSGLAESNTSSSSNTRAPTGANGFLPKAFAGFLPKKNAKAAYDVPIDMTLSMEQFASGAKALDLVRRNWWSMLTMLKVNIGNLCKHPMQALKVRQANLWAQQEMMLRSHIWLVAMGYKQPQCLVASLGKNHTFGRMVRLKNLPSAACFLFCLLCWQWHGFVDGQGVCVCLCDKLLAAIW